MSLWRIEMDDKNSATTVPIYILQDIFLPHWGNGKECQLLLFDVLTQTGKKRKRARKRIRRFPACTP
jgi:hypothetical protein